MIIAQFTSEGYFPDIEYQFMKVSPNYIEGENEEWREIKSGKWICEEYFAHRFTILIEE